jgi:4-hydroxybenzoate polyprenyltransferase
MSANEAARPADALPVTWIDTVAPPGTRPYLRLMRADRPIGVWLLLWPCWWSIMLASTQGAQDVALSEVTYPLFLLKLLLLFAAGAIVMRGAGCVYNDIVDRDIDAKVARTAGRPIPSGQVSVSSAWQFLAVLLLLGLVVLLSLNTFSVVLGAASLIPIAIYPFMKRITDWPQAFLGFTFNWGALLGWSAVMDGLALAPLALFAGSLFWTLGYDTIYAHQDKEDDALIGIKSTALKLGDRSLAWLALFFALALGLIDAAVWLAGGGIIAHCGVAGAALHAAWQLARFDAANPARCLELFRSNRIFGLIITLGLLLDSLLT